MFVKKLVIGLIGFFILNRKFKIFLMSVMIILVIGFKRNVVNNVGILLKLRVRYGGINGNGNLMKVNINVIVFNILIVIKCLFCCIYNFFFLFILFRKGGNLNNKKFLFFFI